MGAVATAIAVNIPQMKTAANLVLVGPMGAGKSVVGSRLAARLGLDFVDLDAAIERDAGASVRELFEREGMRTAVTFAGPRASAAIASTTAESMPPDRPSHTFSKPFLRQ